MEQQARARAIEYKKLCQQQSNSKSPQIGFSVRKPPELRPRQAGMTLCDGVINEADTDDTPSYADRSDQKKQKSNTQRSAATPPKKSRDEEQTSADPNNQMINNADVHGAKGI